MKGSDRFFIEGVSCAMGSHVLPVANLSVGGFYVATPLPPPAGQVLPLLLALGERRCEIMARVTWVNDGHAHRPGDLPAGFGVKITQMTLPDKLALVALLRRSADSGAASRH